MYPSKAKMLVLSSNKYCKRNVVKTFSELVLILVVLDVNIVKVLTKSTLLVALLFV